MLNNSRFQCFCVASLWNTGVTLQLVPAPTPEAHHGSADQSEDFYHILSAEIGIISVGSNRYGHPTANLLHILEQNHTRALRTDQSGLIVLAPSEQGIMVWSEGQARLEAKK